MTVYISFKQVSFRLLRLKLTIASNSLHLNFLNQLCFFGIAMFDLADLRIEFRLSSSDGNNFWLADQFCYV